MLDIIKCLDELRRHSLFMFTLSDLSVIVHNKKLSAPAGFFANFFDIKPMWLDKKGHVTPFDLLPLLKQGDSQYRYWVFPNSTRLAYAD